jgi:cbb3-type cytochrome oxidase maturation protein
MDILFMLVPLSVVLALAILGALGWAVWRGQFEGVDAEGERILRSDD